jgi:AraC-like DNA-binding protein
VYLAHYSMRVLPFQIPKQENSTLIYQEDLGEKFYTELHRHAEIQVSYILEGEGELIVGDSVRHYSANDLFFIGGNLPHLFKSDVSISDQSHMLTIFFTKESFGSNFFNATEFDELKPLFRALEHGIRIEERRWEFKSLFLELAKSSAMERFILFLHILRLASASRHQPLARFVFNKPYSDNDGARMNDIIRFAMASFQREISLAEISDLANMTPNAFCRYFKQRTNKTFFQFLTEIRLEHSCKLLRRDLDLNMIAISEASGFRNLSNFNRMFKRYIGETPGGYRKGIGVRRA